jgi:hypothetical protein
MDRRHAAQLIIALACAACTVPARPLARGVPVDDGAPRSGRALMWVVPADEFRTCGPVASELRRAGVTTSLPLVVVFVGPHPEWMLEYLRAQRLRSGFTALGAREFMHRFGVAPVHAVYLVRDGRVGAALRIRGGNAPDGEIERFVSQAAREGATLGVLPGRRSRD